MRFLRACFFAASVIFACPMKSMAEATVYNTFMLRGISGIVSDGDLSEWEHIPTSTIPINIWKGSENRDDPFGLSKFDGPEDLSASFRAFADMSNVYLAVEVTDDVLVFQRETFGEVWWDDAVRLYLDNGTTLEITRHRNGEILLEGVLEVGGKRMKIPYIWQALGVRAGLQEREDGYVVEVRIPHHFFDVDAIRVGLTINMNVSVLDHDDGGKRDNAVLWSEGELFHDAYVPKPSGRIVIREERQETEPAGRRTEVAKGSRLKARIDDAQENEIVLTLTDNPFSQQLTVEDLQGGSISSIQRFLTQRKSEASGIIDIVWSAGALMELAARGEQFFHALQRLEEIDAAGPPPYISKWSSEYRATLIRSMETSIELTTDPYMAIKQWDQIRQHAANHSDDSLLQRSYASLVKINEKLGSKSAADAVRRDAIRDNERIIQGDPMGQMGLQAAQQRLTFRLQLGEEELARQEVESYIDLFSDQPQVRAMVLDAVATAYRNAQEYDNAITTYQRMLSSSSTEHTSALAEFGLGETYVKLKDYPKAIEQFQAVLERNIHGDTDPSTQDMLHWACLYLAYIHRKTGETSLSMEYYRRLDEYPLPPPPPLQSRPGGRL